MRARVRAPQFGSMSAWSRTEYSGAAAGAAGPTKNAWYEGDGKLKFPSGVEYVGQFHKGEFHGEGALVYPNGGRYQATWERGFAIKGHYVFNDGLLYEDKQWQYVSKNDRRFYTEVKEGLQPAGQTLLTNEKDPPKIPFGAYDTGNGYYEPDSGQVMSYDGKEVVATPGDLEAAWILDHCRRGFDEDAPKEPAAAIAEVPAEEAQ